MRAKRSLGECEGDSGWSVVKVGDWMNGGSSGWATKTELKRMSKRETGPAEDMSRAEDYKKGIRELGGGPKIRKRCSKMGVICQNLNGEKNEQRA